MLQGSGSALYHMFYLVLIAHELISVENVNALCMIFAVIAVLLQMGTSLCSLILGRPLSHNQIQSFCQMLPLSHLWTPCCHVAALLCIRAAAV